VVAIYSSILNVRSNCTVQYKVARTLLKDKNNCF